MKRSCLLPRRCATNAINTSRYSEALVEGEPDVSRVLERTLLLLLSISRFAHRAGAGLRRTFRRATITRQLRETMLQLSSSSAEILATTTQVAAGAAETARAVSETTPTVEEVKQTAGVSSQKAKYVSESAQKVAQVRRPGARRWRDAIARDAAHPGADGVDRREHRAPLRAEPGDRRDHRHGQRPGRAVQSAGGERRDRGGQGRRAGQGVRGGGAGGQEPGRAVQAGDRPGAHDPGRHPEGDQRGGDGDRAGQPRRWRPG